MTRSIAIQEERERERIAAMPKGVYTHRTKTVANSGKTRITTTTTNKKGKVLSESVKELTPQKFEAVQVLTLADQLVDKLEEHLRRANILREAIQILREEGN